MVLYYLSFPIPIIAGR